MTVSSRSFRGQRLTYYVSRRAALFDTIAWKKIGKMERCHAKIATLAKVATVVDIVKTESIRAVANLVEHRRQQMQRREQNVEADDMSKRARAADRPGCRVEMSCLATRTSISASSWRSWTF